MFFPNNFFGNNSSDNLNGVGANSFIGGQFIAEMLGIGMKQGLDFINLWSVVEGNTNALNIGFIDGSTNNKKPIYYHFKMMADIKKLEQELEYEPSEKEIIEALNITKKRYKEYKEDIKETVIECK